MSKFQIRMVLKIRIILNHFFQIYMVENEIVYE